MSTTGPITVPEMTAIVRRLVNLGLPEIAETPDDEAFEMTASATGQRFRVTVAEIPGWSDQIDRELAELTGTEPQR